MFQGKTMGENATLFERMTFSYTEPLFESCQKQRLQFEQFGNPPEHMKVEHLLKAFEDNIQNYLKKDPNDKYAFLKGCYMAKKWFLLEFLIR